MNELIFLIFTASIFALACIYYKIFKPIFLQNETLIKFIILMIVFIIMLEFGVVIYFYSISESHRDNILSLVPFIESLTSIIENPFQFTAERMTAPVCFTLFTIYLFFKLPQGKDIINKIKSHFVYKGICVTSRVFEIAITVLFAFSCFYSQSNALYFPQYLILMVFFSVFQE